MTSITINLTLEQVLEFIQNLPLEYKQAVKQKLEEEKVEEKIKRNTISEFVSDESECNTLESHEITTSNVKRTLTLGDIEEIQNKVEKLRENNELESLKKEFYTEKDKKEIEQPKKSKVDQIAGLVHDPNAPDSKILINKAIVQRYKER